MSTAELNSIKLNLIAWINQLSDADLIGFLDGLRISRAKTDWWEELPASHQKEILAGLKDAESGKVMDSKEFWENLEVANLFPNVESNYHSQFQYQKSVS